MQETPNASSRLTKKVQSMLVFWSSYTGFRLIIEIVRLILRRFTELAQNRDLYSMTACYSQHINAASHCNENANSALTYPMKAANCRTTYAS
jgi:hypothetical protein